MPERLSPSHIEMIAGGMFCGKTEELHRRVRRAEIAKQKVQVFKHSFDDRYAGEEYASSHNGQSIPCEAAASTAELLQRIKTNTTVVAIDEIQFFDDDIIGACIKLANDGARVIGSGLNMDFLGRPFGPMAELIARADEVDYFHAICSVEDCIIPASRTQRILNGLPASPDSPLIMVGADETYVARCREHHEMKVNTAQGDLYTSPDFLDNLDYISADKLRRDPFPMRRG